jgi:hypothetical protein
MSWRKPRYCYLHAARALGVSAITANATVDTNYPVANLIDDRPSVRFKWTDAAADHTIDVDLGAGFVTGIDRLWIPNHNITGAYVVQEDDNGSFTSPTTIGSGSMTSGTDLDKSLTASTERYLRLKITASGAWELGQLWYTTIVTTEAGPEQGWVDELVPNVLQLPSGDSLQTDVDQQLYEFTYPLAGDAAAADLTSLEALIAAVSTYRPFLLDPPYDTEALRIVKLTERARVRSNTLVPNSSARTAEIVLSMMDYLG